jgi:hypothetical protein
MRKKNKGNHGNPVSSRPSSEMDQIEAMMTKKVSETTSVAIDKAVHGLLHKTADRNKICTAVLIDLAVEAMCGSIISYGYDPLKADNEGRRAAIGGIEGAPTITVSAKSTDKLNATALFFGVKVTHLLQDAILGQRYNWQRMQPVNARSMSAIRLQMFELEQLGPQ